MQGLVTIPILSEYPMILSMLLLLAGGLLTLLAGRWSEKASKLLAGISLLGALMLVLMFPLQVQKSTCLVDFIFKFESIK